MKLLLSLLLSCLCVNFAHGMTKEHPAYGRYHRDDNLPSQSKIDAIYKTPRQKYRRVLLPVAPELHRDIYADRDRDIHADRVRHNHDIPLELRQPMPEVVHVPQVSPRSVEVAQINAHSTTKVACIALAATVLSSGVTAAAAIYLSNCK